MHTFAMAATWPWRWLTVTGMVALPAAPRFAPAQPWLAGGVANRMIPADAGVGADEDAGLPDGVPALLHAARPAQPAAIRTSARRPRRLTLLAPRRSGQNLPGPGCHRYSAFPELTPG
jgi:hypothetical protein